MLVVRCAAGSRCAEGMGGWKRMDRSTIAAVSSAVDGAYLTDRSASLAKSIKDVEGELLQGQGARGRSDASLRARSRVAELRRALGATLGPLLAEAESAGLGNQLDGVRAELGRSEASVAFLERVVAADEAAASAGELARRGDVVGC
ncbi:expressed protein, partial [Aureococcus anophagefferens]